MVAEPRCEIGLKSAVSQRDEGAPSVAQRGGNSPGAPAWIRRWNGNHKGLGKGMSEEESKRERKKPL